MCFLHIVKFFLALFARRFSAIFARTRIVAQKGHVNIWIMQFYHINAHLSTINYQIINEFKQLKTGKNNDFYHFSAPFTIP